MCKLLAVLAMLAKSNTKATAIASANVSTASAFSTSDNVVPTHGGGMVMSWKPNSDPQVPLKLV